MADFWQVAGFWEGKRELRCLIDCIFLEWMMVCAMEFRWLGGGNLPRCERVRVQTWMQNSTSQWNAWVYSSSNGITTRNFSHLQPPNRSIDRPSSIFSVHVCLPLHYSTWMENISGMLHSQNPPLRQRKSKTGMVRGWSLIRRKRKIWRY